MAQSRRVFALGAGFTKAFLPEAPLITDDYQLNSLTERFSSFPDASRILALEREANPGGRINIERLMTRLEGGMPYDSESARDELRLLYAALRKAFVQRLNAAIESTGYTRELADFAGYCLRNQITCITFNHDDVLDRALWEVEKAQRLEHPRPYWHPDGGYGFFCKPSASCVLGLPVSMDKSATLLLKLHGSINWRPKRGAQQPYTLDAIVHHEPWLPLPEREGANLEAIESHLEAESFIIPPILMKSALIGEPILRLVWSLAYHALRSASEVMFVGYSLPSTDIAARFLFSEALAQLDQSQITVVNYAEGADRKETMTRYQAIFAGMKEDQFNFNGALEWSKELMKLEARAERTGA